MNTFELAKGKTVKVKQNCVRLLLLSMDLKKTKTARFTWHSTGKHAKKQQKLNTLKNSSKLACYLA